MNNKNAKMIFALIVLVCVCFTACENPIMETWWDSSEQPPPPPPMVYHKVTFEADGGLPAPGSQLIAHGGKIAKLSVMSKDHYGFGGWFTDDKTFKNEWDFAADTVDKDVTLYAQWVPISLVVTFEANGGSPPPGSQGIIKGGKIVEPPPMSKPGQGFGGWYTDKDCTKGNEWVFTKEVNSSLTLYARWEADHYTVTFVENGGSPPPIDQRIAYEGRIVEPPAMSKTGNGFGGWYEDPGFNNEWNFASKTVTDNVTLYAKWEPSYSVITFVANGGSPAPNSQSAAYGIKVISPPAMTKENESFGGWYIDSGFVNEWDFATPVTSNVTLYAKWSPISYTVTFNANGGTPQPPAQNLIHGSKIVKPPAMDLAGQGFDGWYTEAGFTNEWNFAADTVDKNLTLYAKWHTDYRTVTFNANGGTVAPGIQQVAVGKKAAEPPAMSKAGNGFGGWYTEAGFINEWHFAENTVDGDVTLYARWIPNYYTVTFVANGGSPPPNAQSVADGSRVVSPSAMTKTGEGFGGWYTDSAFAAIWDFATDTVSDNVTLYAQWLPISSSVSYTVTFNAAGGTPAPEPQSLIDGSKIVKPLAMSKADNGFDGWYTDDETFTNEWDFAADTVASDVTLYAKWHTEYRTVTFNADGGAPAPGNQRIVQGKKITEPPAMIRTGNGFGGWYTEAGVEWDFAAMTVDENVILYARWVPNYYTVTFAANGGTVPPDDQSIAYGTRVVTPSNMTKTGESFGGWYTDSSFTAIWNFATDTVSGDVTLYAKWLPISYTVTFTANGGTPAPSTQSLTYGSKIVEPPAMSKDGNGFDGWYTDSGLTNKWNFAADTVDRNITLYAKWHTEYRTVTFNADGGTPAPGEQLIVVGGSIVEPPAMSKTGNGFGGWYKDPAFTEPWNPTTDTVTSDLTLYAKWVLNHYTITFNAQGGSPVPPNQDVNYNTKVVRPAPMSRTGFSFGGWYTDENCADVNEWDFAEKITFNFTLYAKWEKNLSIYTVLFDADPGVSPNQSLANPWPEPQSIVEGAKAVEPSAMRKAISRGSDMWYGFGGWFRDSGFTVPWNFARDKITEDVTEDGILTLYAKWDDPHCLVTFEANGGDPVPRSQDLIEGTRIVEPLVMNRPGYGFGGWYKNEAFTEQWNFAVDVVTTETLTLYAYWVTNYYTVTFEANGGTPAPASQTIAHGSTVTTPPGMRKPGEGFVGWYTDSALTSEWNFATDTVTSEKTLYAKWGAIQYTVMFKLKPPPGTGVDGTSGHGNPFPDDQHLGNNGKVSEPPPVNIAGWSFVGWYYSSDPSLSAKNGDWSQGELDTLEEWDFDQPVTTTYTNLVGGRETLYLYARWVPYVPGFVWVRKGNFTMGDSHISGSSPARPVKLSGYYMSLYTVSQENYVSVTGLPNPSQFTAIDTRPVEKISWYDAIEYCNIRSLQEGLNPAYSLSGADPAQWGPKPTTSPSNWDNIVLDPNAKMSPSANGYRLPTEAEWEYAARGGNGSPGGFTYAGSNNADDVAWYNLNSGGVTHPIGIKAPNGLGIYDMSGNVSEWCWDWFAPYSSSDSPDDDPTGALSGTERVRRGGAYSNNYTNVRTVIRNSFTPDNANWVMGFRVVRGPAEVY